ncbi:MAG: hypothetical protein M1827_004633 [Pycnora praestabilis]|nr:MAG: hypothetical protein M1827_004633 [Pycnora praestabilis]
MTSDEVGSIAPPTSGDEKPSVLIIGGMGYLGRFLALYIQRYSLASEVRLVDKVLPQLAWLAPEFEEACSQDKFMQADASRERALFNVCANIIEIVQLTGLPTAETLPRIFDRSSGKQFDYVFNCGGETRYSQDDEVYRLRSLNLSVAVGKEAAKRKVKAFVEVSTGMVYKPDPSPRKETDKTKPWLKMAKWKLTAEEELAKIEGLNLVVLRLAHVYGDYSSKFVATALSLARVYKHLEKEMKWLWDKDLRVNTVHVDDAVRSMWKAAEWVDKGRPGWNGSWGKVALFNIVDHGNTYKSLRPDAVMIPIAQGTMSAIIGSIFSIPTGFQGSLISSFARLNLDSVVDDVNDEILSPWADLLTAANITRPGPLSPFMEKELLRDTDLSLDGSRFEKVTGFKYEKDRITKEEVEAMIQSYRRMNWWP